MILAVEKIPVTNEKHVQTDANSSKITNIHYFTLAEQIAGHFNVMTLLHVRKLT
jgi:hypothetical protein